jgi:prefoldin subunit 5
MADNGMTVDPELVNQAYKQMLADSQGQVALLQAAATQLQRQVAQLTSEKQSLENSVQELTAANERLMVDSGRHDGVPQEPEPATA